MQDFIDDDTKLKLITAPEVVRTAYVKTDQWIAMWPLWMQQPPSTEAIDAAFWETFGRLGGTDADFDWMLAADLCDETDRPLFHRARATV